MGLAAVIGPALRRPVLALVMSLAVASGVAACSGDDPSGASPTPSTSTPSTPAPSTSITGSASSSTSTSVAASAPASGVVVSTSAPTSVTTSVPTSVPPGTSTSPVTAPVPLRVTRIVSLSPTHTETLFAIGAGELVVAVDPASDHPAEARTLQRAGFSDQLADVGAIVALEPDLVVVGDDPTDIAARLRSAGIAAWRGPQPADVDGAFAQIVELGALVGRVDAARALVASMESDLAELRTGIGSDGTVTFFHEIDPSLYTIGPGSFLDAVYGSLGLVNIAPARSGETVFQLTSDEVVAADPDVILLADAACCGASPATVAARPGWAGVSAVERGAVVVLDEAVASRWGPRLVDLWRAVAAAAAPTAG